MKTILHIDDSAFARELFALAIARTSYHLISAADGLEALNIIKTQIPDLVILDEEMPNLDGLTTLRIMRATPDFKNIPVIMLTANEDRDHIRIAVQIGVQEYILKSQFALDSMMARIDKYLSPQPLAPSANDSLDHSNLDEPPPAPIAVLTIDGEIDADFV